MSDATNGLLTVYLIGAILALGLSIFVFFATKNKK